MIANRQRGLVELHRFLSLLVVAVFFWLYAEFIMRWLAETVRLSREVNLVPYFLCVLIGLLVGGGPVGRFGARLHRLTGGEAANLATQQVFFIALVVFTMMVATQDRSISRLFLATFLVFSWVILLALHLALPRRIARTVFGSGAQVPTLFVGRVEAMPRFREWVERGTTVGLKPVGYVAVEDNGGAEARPGVLGRAEDLPELLERFQIGQVVMLEVPPQPEKARRILEQCQERGCRLLIHHALDEKLEHPLTVIEEGGHQFLTLHDEPLEEPLNRAVKRVFDIAVSLPVVVLVLPWLCALVWLVQRVQSRGPLFHVRPRTGEQREPFPMVKFRTMHLGPFDPAAEARQASAGDERVYPFGHFLRRHSLDEFPQFWNVLVGDMSIVGPRPVMPLLDEEFERQVRSYRSKHWVKPGITGLAQSRGFRGEIKTPAQLQERIRLDLNYLARWSIWLDLQITLRTFWQIFFPPKSAY